jgi:phage terminase large subunit GpA-like protein
VEEREKAAMVAAGRWRATAPSNGHAGFRINALVSPHHNAAWGKLAAEFLVARRDPTTLQTFTNLVLGEPWQIEGDTLDESDLRSRREPWGLDDLPQAVLFLTAGVDCQDDRLECTIVGHGADAQFVLQHLVFHGPIDSAGPWEELDALLRTRWPHPNSGTIGVDAAAVDGGDGGHHEIVSRFARPRFNRRVVMTKGVAGFSRPLLQRSTAKGQILFLAGVDAAKAQLFARLARGQGVRFSRDLEAVYFEQLTSERRVVRYARGAPVQRFERIPGKRAECLDATVYAICARQLIGVALDRRAEELSTPAAPARPSNVIRSQWLNRN